jgi:hypothetical protein
MFLVGEKRFWVLLLNLFTVKFSTKTSSLQKVDLSKLEMAALWRYWGHFNLVSFSNRRKLLVDLLPLLKIFFFFFMY